VTRALEVLAPGPFATVQDLGRPGLARLGVGRSGAADRSALRLANRLVGNPEYAAGVEATYGGLVVRAVGSLVVALAGAPCAVTGAGGRGGMYVPLHLADGEEVRLGPPSSGLRTYLAVRGGLAVAPVLGARATDTLAGLGPAPLAAGDRLPVGSAVAGEPAVEQAPCSAPAAGRVRLRVVRGPRDDWFTPAALDALVSSPYVVSGESDRVGMRLDGPTLERARAGELPSEGMVAGALQVPPAGRPVLMLADHPVTGGYPVVAVLVDDDLDRAGQLRPGQEVEFTLSREARGT
jgi:biotin-dependent carboxylase-like uncharacterized protein